MTSMRKTTDTYSGKPFRWNTTVVVKDQRGHLVIVPARSTSRFATHLDPSRVLPALLAKLNPEMPS